MQQVVIIELNDWQGYQKQQTELLRQQSELLKRIARLEKGLNEYVGTKEACKITGLSVRSLYDARKDGRVAYKYEGKKPFYLRTSLEELNETCTPRKKRA